MEHVQKSMDTKGGTNNRMYPQLESRTEETILPEKGMCCLPCPTGSLDASFLSEENGPAEEVTCCVGAYPTGFYPELKGTMKLAWPLILAQTSQFAFNTVAILFGGHLGKVELDAIALSNSIINAFGNTIIVGFSSCLDTVLPQSYGNGSYRMLGIYMQRGLILTLPLLLLCLTLHLNIKPLLLAAGQNREVVEMTEQYLLYFSPGLCFLFMWTILRKFTQCQNLVIPHFVISLVGHPIHALLQYLFLYHFQWGISGSAMAQGISFFVIFLLTLIYSRYSKAYELCWYGWDRHCLLDWGPLASMAVFGMLMICMEWWVFEAAVIMAGILGQTELGAQSIAYNLEELLFGIALGIAMATSVRVGQFLGAGETAGAITAARMGMTLGAISSGVCAAVLLVAKDALPKLFTDDPDISNLVSELMPFVAFNVVGGGISGLGRGVLKGTGLHRWGSLVSGIAYYVVALPLGIPLTFLTTLGITGLWIGLCLALSLMSVIYFIAISFCCDWEKLKDEAIARASGKQIKTAEDTPLLADDSTSFDNLTIPTSLYLKRVATIALFLGIFVVGVTIRVTSQRTMEINVSQQYNTTLSQQYNTTLSQQYNTTLSQQYNTTLLPSNITVPAYT